ncbi:MAG TPA: hypothetical protein VGG74_13470 [Kofleriaceae bacterium]|jgi:hypothetical protein
MHRLAISLVVLAACAKHDAPAASGGSAAPSPVATAGDHSCGSMRGDFQALVSVPLTEVSGAPVGACNAYVSKGQPGFVLAALIYSDTPVHEFAPTGPGAHVVSGVGDQAYWVMSPGEGPRFEAKKGTYTCEISAPEQDKSTLKSMSEADQAAYAQLMGKLCNDMFAAQ